MPALELHTVNALLKVHTIWSLWVGLRAIFHINLIVGWIIFCGIRMSSRKATSSSK
jgi:hypothetical protein